MRLLHSKLELAYISFIISFILFTPTGVTSYQPSDFGFTMTNMEKGPLFCRHLGRLDKKKLEKMSRTTFSVSRKYFRDGQRILIMQPSLTSFSNSFRKCNIFCTLITFLELKVFIFHGLMLFPSPHT